MDPNGIVMMTGGISIISNKVENKCIFIDCATERLREVPDLLEPKFKHHTVASNNKFFVLGGFTDISMT